MEATNATRLAEAIHLPFCYPFRLNGCIPWVYQIEVEDRDVGWFPLISLQKQNRIEVIYELQMGGIARRIDG